MDHELKKQPKLNGKYSFDDDFNTIITPAHNNNPPTGNRIITYDNNDQVQFQFNQNGSSLNNSNRNFGQGHGAFTVRCERKKLSSKFCNPIVILSVISLTAVAGGLFSTFYLIHSLKPASTFIDNVNGIMKSKEMQEVDSTVNSFLKNATNWVKQNIGGKKAASNQTEELSNKKKKKGGELVLFGEGNGFSLNSLANLAGQIIKSVNDTISSIANNQTNIVGNSKEAEANQQSLIEKSAQESSDSKARLVSSSSDEPLDSGQKVYHMS